MKCDSCGKLFPLVHVTEIQNGVNSERHFCENCAEELGLPFQNFIEKPVVLVPKPDPFANLMKAVMEKQKRPRQRHKQ
jgi:protein-arginine kinase activator protein McsA